MFRPPAAALTLLLLAACASGRATPPTPAPTATPRTTAISTPGGGTIEVRTTTTQDRAQGVVVKIAPDVAWKVIPAAYGDLALPVTTYVTDTRQIGSAHNRARGRIGNVRIASLVSCGADMLGEDKANSYEVMLEVSTGVAAADAGSTRLTTLVTATARPMATSGDPLHCTSTGQLEKRIVNAVIARSAGQ